MCIFHNYSFIVYLLNKKYVLNFLFGCADFVCM